MQVVHIDPSLQMLLFGWAYFEAYVFFPVHFANNWYYVSSLKELCSRVYTP